MNFISSSLNPSADSTGYLTTTTSPQVFTFVDNGLKRQYTLSALAIQASTAVSVQYNKDSSIEYIDAGQIGGPLGGINVTQITITSPIGTKFRYKGTSCIYKEIV